MPDKCSVLLKYPDGYNEVWMDVEIMGGQTFLVMDHWPTPSDPPLRIEIEQADLVEVNWSTIRWLYLKPLSPPNPWGN
jgi:hypothetical protein